MRGNGDKRSRVRRTLGAVKYRVHLLTAPNSSRTVASPDEPTVSGLNTDADWEWYGQNEPYFGVLTNPKFSRENLDERGREEFFESGRKDVELLLETVRSRIDRDFAPDSVLEFGCGVGRNLGAFSDHVERIVGVDVSASMLAEARENCWAQGLTNVTLLESDDALSRVDGQFDLVYSFIVFQHIPVERGEAILRALWKHLAPGGVGVIQLTYEGLHGPDPGPPERRPAGQPPPMQMNRYDLNRVFGILQDSGVREVFFTFTDHGGHLGVHCYFQRPKLL